MSHFVLPTSTTSETFEEQVTEVIHPGEDDEPDTIELPPRIAGGRRWHELPSLASARRSLSL